MTQALSAKLAAQFARVALDNVGREYPYHVLHLLHGDADARPPRDLHPVFHGSYDWHSCVHMHWTLARCLRRFPALAESGSIAAHFDARITPDAVAREIAYFETPGHATFERPYGWGWLLALQAELDRLPQRHWHDALAPLAALIAQRFVEWLPRQQYPVRNGTHANSAFALIHAFDDARRAAHPALRAAIVERARAWFAHDRRYPADYEPGGDDFLSGGLCEALLMQRADDAGHFGPWWAEFEPEAAALARWLAPVAVSDPRDAKIVHLHGLNLSRAWCWRALAPHLPERLRAAVADAAAAHVEASLPAALAGDYVGTHWLASFALLALDTHD